MPLAAALISLALLQPVPPVVPFATALPQQDDVLPELERFDFVFPGGTLEELAKVLRKVAVFANFVVSPEAAEVTIPPMELRRVDLSTIMTLIERPRANSFVEAYMISPGDGPQTPTYHLRLANLPENLAPPPQFAAIALARLIDNGLTTEAILEAIEASLMVSLGDEATQAEVRYHEPTRILFVRGSKQAVGTVRETIGAMEMSSGPNSNERARLKQLEQELSMEKAQITGFQNSLRQCQEQNQSANMAMKTQQSELATLRERVGELSSELSHRNGEIGRLEGKLREVSPKS